LPRSIMAPSLVAHILVDKYRWGLLPDVNYIDPLTTTTLPHQFSSLSQATNSSPDEARGEAIGS